MITCVSSGVWRHLHHRRGDVHRLEPAVKTLYVAYAQDDVVMQDFAGVTLGDLFRAETTLEMNVCAYKLVQSDEDDGKTTAELVRRSLFITQRHCTSTFTRPTFPTFKMYARTVTRIKVESAVTLYGNAHICNKNTSVRVRDVRQVYTVGVYHSTSSVFERVDDENIRIFESLVSDMMDIL